LQTLILKKKKKIRQLKGRKNQKKKQERKKKKKKKKKKTITKKKKKGTITQKILAKKKKNKLHQGLPFCVIITNEINRISCFILFIETQQREHSIKCRALPIFAKRHSCIHWHSRSCMSLVIRQQSDPAIVC